ncbi:MAG: glycosyl hydrolase [Ruminococcus sp.]|nr:glycosyl hydrolase [Ruminococcus sp.]
MKFKILTVIACVFSILVATGCGTRIHDNRDIIDNYVEDSESVAESSEMEPEQTEIKVGEIRYVKFDKTVQAEDGVISGKTKIASERKGYKGKGYVTGFYGNDNLWSVSVELKDSQFYNIAVTTASDKKKTSKLAVNGEIIGEISNSGKKAFETFSLNNVYMKKGSAVITIICEKGDVDVDYVRVTAVKNTITSDVSKTKISNKNADEQAQKLYEYLKSAFGKQVILGQHDTVGTHFETDKIFEFTGKYPAIRFGDLMMFTEDENISAQNEIDYAIEWSKEGGIVGYMWHWQDPLGSGEYYADKTDFDLSKAMTKQKIAMLTPEDIEKLHKEKKISDECMAIINDIDKISEQLKILRDNDIAVIWRPLHEASNGYFWWGNDSDSYKWLWKLLYERQTSYHKLDNLIWVWSAQNVDWYVGDEMCDIISADIYDKGDLSGQKNTMLFLTKICKTKPIAISECGNLPDMNLVAEDNALWSYIGNWGGNYLLNEDGSLNEEYNAKEQLISAYNNSLVVTRDKLPDLKVK